MSPDAALFWHQHAGGRYSRDRAGKLLVRVLRRARLKPAAGRVGPRVHDLRHAFVASRMLAWYREGINPQSRLPYLATYLGHKDINSTLVYLTVTQNLLQQASERFRVRGARLLRASDRRRKRMKPNQFPQLLHAFFHDWLVQQRNVSHHTVLSYRDSWRLFLRFVAAQKTKSVAKLGMDDLTAVEVLAFLKDIEQVRKSSIGTRNCRLARCTASLASSPTVNRWRLHNAPRSCAYPPNKHPYWRSAISTKTRSARFSHNRIA